MLEDRAGKEDISFLTANVDKFMDAARKRPEIASVNTTFLPVVPQLYVDVDRDKALKEGVELDRGLPDAANVHGRLLRQLLQPLRPAVAGLCGGRRTSIGPGRRISAVLCAQHMGQSLPLARADTIKSSTGSPEFTMRYNEYRCAQINGAGAARLQLRPGHEGARGGLRPNHAAGHGL